MRLEVCGLSKAFVAVVKRAHIRPVTGVDTNVCAEVEIQREPLTTTLKGALQRR